MHPRPRPATVALSFTRLCTFNHSSETHAADGLLIGERVAIDHPRNPLLSRNPLACRWSSSGVAPFTSAGGEGSPEHPTTSRRALRSLGSLPASAPVCYSGGAPRGGEGRRMRKRNKQCKWTGRAASGVLALLAACVRASLIFVAQGKRRTYILPYTYDCPALFNLHPPSRSATDKKPSPPASPVTHRQQGRHIRQGVRARAPFLVLLRSAGRTARSFSVRLERGC